MENITLRLPNGEFFKDEFIISVVVTHGYVALKDDYNIVTFRGKNLEKVFTTEVIDNFKKNGVEVTTE